MGAALLAVLFGSRGADGRRQVNLRPALVRALAYGFLGAVVAFVAVSAIMAVLRPDPAAQIAAADSYLEAFKPLTEEAGFVVEQGLKAGVEDIGNDRYDDETLEGMPRAWHGMLIGVREQMAALRPPPPLREAHDRFLEAMDGYIEVTVLLSAAMEQPRGQRSDAAQRAGDLGSSMDQVWNAGAFVVQDHLRSLGADPVYWLPDAQDPSREDPSP